MHSLARTDSALLMPFLALSALLASHFCLAQETSPPEFLALSGIHRLQLFQYTGATTAENPIEVTAQDSTTTGDPFRLAGGLWRFSLDTKATGMTTGIGLLRATLSDGIQHAAWIQLK